MTDILGIDNNAINKDAQDVDALVAKASLLMDEARLLIANLNQAALNLLDVSNVAKTFVQKFKEKETT